MIDVDAVDNTSVMGKVEEGLPGLQGMNGYTLTARDYLSASHIFMLKFNFALQIIKL